MRGMQIGILCVLCLWVRPLFPQSSDPTPMHFSAGEVLTFYSQSRLHPSSDNPLDALPKGTALRVKLLEGIDSTTKTDGAAFHGILELPLADTHNATLVEEHAEVRGLFVLLRSKMHPEGFRYELLLTGISVHGKMQDLTATLNSSLSDTTKPVPAQKPLEEANPRELGSATQSSSPRNSNP